MATKQARPRQINHLFFAAFICLIGVALFAVAMASVGFTRAGEAAGEARVLDWTAISGLAFFGAGVGLLFVGIHLRRYGRLRRPRPERPDSSLERWRRRLGQQTATFGIVFCLFGLYQLYQMTAVPERPGPTREFALVIPAEDMPGTGAAARNAGPAQGDAAPAERGSILFWSVPPTPQPQHPGLLSMVLASALTIAFGLAYPQIAESGDEEGRGFVQKLVVPALGMALFGVGASESASAEKDRQDVALISQGLPPILSVSKDQRKIYSLGGSDLSPAAVRELQKQVGDLSVAVRDGQKLTVKLTEEGRRELAYQINDVRQRIGISSRISAARSNRMERQLSERLENGFATADASVRDMRQWLGSASTDLRAAFEGMKREDRENLCQMLRGQMDLAAGQQSIALAFMTRQDQLDSTNAFRRAWLSLRGHTYQGLSELTEAKQRELRSQLQEDLMKLRPECQKVLAGDVAP